jgi:hypothetical protein
MKTQNILVVTGTGGMGIKRIAAGRNFILPEVSDALISNGSTELESDGFIIETCKFDNSSKTARSKHFAQASANGQRVETVVHNAGLQTPTCSGSYILSMHCSGLRHQP